MTSSNQVMAQPHQINGAIMEKVVLGNDLASLSSIEKVKYINGVCKSLGLNPATNPIKLMKFNGKEILYFSKESTEQLRTINHVSIENIESKTMDGIYIVTAHAVTPDGRKDASTGAIAIKGLQGDALCNAIMKAETKAKRRVTLSICGLGFNDESEMDSLKGASKVNLDAHRQAANNQKLVTQQIEDTTELEIKFIDFMADINSQDHIDGLQSVFGRIKKTDFNAKPDLFKKLIDAKDKRKSELIISSIDNQSEESYSNPETGEVE
jgi:hypothetical protein